MRIHGKVALITGASGGIGAACAAELRRRGARLSLVARSAAALEQVGGADAVLTAGDITQPETRERAVSATLERFGRLDILVNNAGVGLYAPAWRAPLDQARAMFELNFFAPLALAQRVVPEMRRAGGGMIVNVGSIAGKVTLPWFTLYSTSKYALGSLSDGLRMELRRDRIHVMTVCPGYVKTAFQQNVLGGRPPDRVLQGRRFAITAGQCARAVARGIEREARTVVVPRAGWLFVAMERLLPGFVDARMAAATDQA